MKSRRLEELAAPPLPRCSTCASVTCHFSLFFFPSSFFSLFGHDPIEQPITRSETRVSEFLGRTPLPSLARRNDSSLRASKRDILSHTFVPHFQVEIDFTGYPPPYHHPEEGRGEEGVLPRCADRNARQRRHKFFRLPDDTHAARQRKRRESTNVMRDRRNRNRTSRLRFFRSVGCLGEGEGGREQAR